MIQCINNLAHVFIYLWLFVTYHLFQYSLSSCMTINNLYDYIDVDFYLKLELVFCICRKQLGILNLHGLIDYVYT